MERRGLVMDSAVDGVMRRARGSHVESNVPGSIVTTFYSELA